MTKDLALLVGGGQKWQSTEEFMQTIADRLAAKLSQKAAA